MSDRRDFFRRIASGAAGLALAGGTGWLMLKSGKPCWADGGCRSCPQLDGCDQPEARVVRVQRLPARGEDGRE